MVSARHSPTKDIAAQQRGLTITRAMHVRSVARVRVIKTTFSAERAPLIITGNQTSDAPHPRSLSHRILLAY